MALPTKSTCDPTKSNEDPFMARGRAAQSQRAAARLLGWTEKNVLHGTSSLFRVTDFKKAGGKDSGGACG